MWSAIAGIISSILGGEASSGGSSSASANTTKAENPAPAPTNFSYNTGNGLDNSQSSGNQQKKFSAENPGPWGSVFNEAKNFGASTAHNAVKSELDGALQGTGVDSGSLMSLANSLFNMKGGK